MKLKIELREGTLIALPQKAVGLGHGVLTECRDVAHWGRKEKGPQVLVTWSPRKLAGCTGLEPVASGVTGRRYNQLN
jgi:hypothetical protein